MAEVGRKKYILNSLDEKYLLVKRVSYDAGLLFFVIPVTEKKEDWYRWEKIQK